MRRIYITDCEGSVAKNDIACQIAAAFLPEGRKLMSRLNEFDAYLGAIERTSGHIYGSALRYILPFLKAAGVTDGVVRNFCKQQTRLVE